MNWALRDRSASALPSMFVRECAVDALGITAPDIRDWWREPTRDEVTIRLWNGRRLSLPGLKLFSWWHTRPDLHTGLRSRIKGRAAHLIIIDDPTGTT